MDSNQSRADLECEIDDLQSQIKQAIARIDFKEASSLQSMLDERDKRREHFPSVKELQVWEQRAKQ